MGSEFPGPGEPEENTIGNPMPQVKCPYCQSENAAEGRRVGEILDCSECDRSFTMPPLEAPAAENPASHPAEPVPLGTRSGRVLERSAPGDVNLAITGGIALAVTAFFYLAIIPLLEGSTLSALFAERGWVPYVIAFLSAWSGVALVIKYRSLHRQERALEFDLLPNEIAELITPENSHVFASYVRNLPSTRYGNFLTGRVHRALKHFRARPSVNEVVDQLRIQADADADAVESSYTMLKVFIWAVPILGFIGTVMGIGAAVGGFSEAVDAASDLGVLRNSLGSVTNGLGVAFDTTLLALVMSVFIMFPTTFLQKAEESFLASVEAYCNEHLVRRLDDGAGPTATDRTLPERQLAVMNRLADVIVDLEQRLSKIEDAGSPSRGPER